MTHAVIGHYTVEDIRKMVAFEAEAGDGEYSPKTEVIKFLLNEIERKDQALMAYANYDNWVNDDVWNVMCDPWIPALDALRDAPPTPDLEARPNE